MKRIIFEYPAYVNHIFDDGSVNIAASILGVYKFIDIPKKDLDFIPSAFMDLVIRGVLHNGYKKIDVSLPVETELTDEEKKIIGDL